MDLVSGLGRTAAGTADATSASPEASELWCTSGGVAVVGFGAVTVAGEAGVEGPRLPLPAFGGSASEP